MIQKPPTKKLSKKIQYASVGYMPIDKDEKFYNMPGYSNIFVSQFAQIIQTYKNGKAIVRKTSYDITSGYTTIVLINKLGERKCWGIHNLVAIVWLEHPSFVIEDEPLEAHHIVKVKANLKAQPISINFADNLMYVYKKYHKILDTTRSIKVSTYGGGWKSVKTIDDIAKHFNMELKEVYDLLLKNPTYKVGTLEYYDIDDRKSIEIRKYKAKPKKKRKAKKQ